MQYFGFDRTLGRGSVLGFGDTTTVIEKPTMSQYILSGNAGVAVDYAVNGLVSGDFEWAIDTDNSRIIITTLGNPYLAPSGKGWSVNGLTTVIMSYTPQGACEIAYQYYPRPANGGGALLIDGLWYCPSPNASDPGFNVTLFNGQPTDTAPPAGGDSYIAIEVIADKVIANAQAGHLESQQAVENTSAAIPTA